MAVINIDTGDSYAMRVPTAGGQLNAESQTIPAGANQIYIKNSGAATGTVNGVNLIAGDSLNLVAPAGFTLGQCALVATSTTFEVYVVGVRV